jgi:hypothetical protein
LEALDGRALPSTFIGTDFIAYGLGAEAANQAPVISDFKSVVGPHGQVTFSGNVTDDQAVAGYVVHIMGQGVDVAAVVQNDGAFSITTTVTGTSDITVSAIVTDLFGETSAPAYTTFTPTN